MKTKIILNLHLSQWHLSTMYWSCPLPQFCPFLPSLSPFLPPPLPLSPFPFPPLSFPSPPPPFPLPLLPLPLPFPSSVLPFFPFPFSLFPFSLLSSSFPPPLPFPPPIPFPFLSFFLPPLLLCLSPFLFSTSLPICSYISPSELVLVDSKQRVLMMIAI